MSGWTTWHCRRWGGRCQTPLVMVRKNRVRSLVPPDSSDKRGVDLTCPTCGRRRRVSMQAPGPAAA